VKTQELVIRHVCIGSEIPGQSCAGRLFDRSPRMVPSERAGALLSLCRQIAATAGASGHRLASTRRLALQQLGNLRGTPGFTAGALAKHYQTWAAGPSRQLQRPFAPFSTAPGRIHTTATQALVHPKLVQHPRQHPFARLARLIHGTPAPFAAAVGPGKGATRGKGRPWRALLVGVPLGLGLGLGLGALWGAGSEERRSLLRGYLALPVRLWRDVATATAMALGEGLRSVTHCTCCTCCTYCT